MTAIRSTSHSFSHPCRVLAASVKGGLLVAWTDTSREQLETVSRAATTLLDRLRFP